MKSKLKSVVAASAFFGIVSTASAEVVFVTYKGTVSVGYDQTGIFGPPNSSLDGDKYTASYIFDTSVGVIQNVPSYNSALGGYAFSEPQPSPSLGAILTIDGVSVGFGGGALGQIYGADYGTFTRSYADARDYGSAYNFYTYNFVTNQMTDPSRTIPMSITEPFTYKANNSNGGSGQGSFQIVSYQNG
jgi:hypothetical protein